MLSKPPRSPKSDPEDLAIQEIVDWILEKDFRNRPTATDIIIRIRESHLSKYSKTNNFNV